MGKTYHTNALINESSPYLLQHAHNPVNWQPWGTTALETAQREDKLILVSIGYSACHWCHVMEHECFKDEEVAQIMNSQFVCIKVDREERPDVDHFFMTAVQLTGAQGGWPLNCIALPNGEPVWCGTYFPKNAWINILNEFAQLYINQRHTIIRYAANLADGIRQSLLTVLHGAESPSSLLMIENTVTRWKNSFDLQNGGINGAPKFPMPGNLSLLMHYGFIFKDLEVLDFVELTLDKMAMGGLYDHAGGGFARYAVDEIWKIPHFEKMLYDNAQLLSVYSKAYQLTGKKLYKNIVYETVNFLERELMHLSGAFYSSLDADSEGVEGKFYVWTKPELENLLMGDFELFAEYYNINDTGFWEDGNYILYRTQNDDDFQLKFGLTAREIDEKVETWKSILLSNRSSRTRPALDDKTLISWNALVINGLCDAFKAFEDARFMLLAKQTAKFIIENASKSDGGLFHSWKQGKPAINGFCEDYALVIQSFINLFSVSGEEFWLNKAMKLTEYTRLHFLDNEQNMYWFSETGNDENILNHFQTIDNVVSSSNSVMAGNLFALSRILGLPEFENQSKKMVCKITHQFMSHPSAFSNWGQLMLMLNGQFYEIAVTGPLAAKFAENIQSKYLPNTLVIFSTNPSDIPLLYQRHSEPQTLIYVCTNGTCQLPVESPEKALLCVSYETKSV